MYWSAIHAVARMLRENTALETLLLLLSGTAIHSLDNSTILSDLFYSNDHSGATAFRFLSICLCIAP